MRRRLLATYLTVTLVMLLALVYPLGQLFAASEQDRLLRDIEHDAAVIGGLSEDALERGSVPPLGDSLASYARDPGGRIVVVDKAGRSVADSNSGTPIGTSFANRPEIAAAIGGGRAEGRRHSETLDADLLFVAIPVASSGVVHGAVRITYPSSTLDHRVRSMWIGLVALSAAVLAVVTVVGVLLARAVTRPVERLKTAARSVAAGDRSARAPTDLGVPELRELALTFNETTDRLEEVLDSQAAFVGDASHQLRTPLAALRLQLENIESAAPADLQPAVAAARSETARLSRISDALLTLIRSAGTDASPAPVDLVPIVIDRHRTWSAIAADNGVELVRSGANAAWARAVPGSVEQMLDNLISNALEFAPAGSTVRMEVDGDRDPVRIRVIDEGPGMTDEERDRAFDRFWRGPDATPGGTGLGLAIVAQLASRCGGAVRLEASPGGGVAAVVELPAARAPSR